MALVDWLITGLEKSSSPLKKFILPTQEIHLAHSLKHYTNKILKKTKAYYAVQLQRRELPE